MAGAPSTGTWVALRPLTGPRVQAMLGRILLATVAAGLAAIGDPLPEGLRWGVVGAAVAALALGTDRAAPGAEVGVAFAGAWGVFLLWLGTRPGTGDMARTQFLVLGGITMAGLVVFVPHRHAGDGGDGRDADAAAGPVPGARPPAQE